MFFYFFGRRGRGGGGGGCLSEGSIGGQEGDGREDRGGRS